MKKIITLQVGQCGNQIGYEFWKRLAEEHGIEPDGTLIQTEKESSLADDRKDIFCYSADDGRYIPRAILYDLEPKVIGSIRGGSYSHFYNPENMLTPLSGGGASNIWSQGYASGQETYELISDAIRREAEQADALEGFILCHSIAGGTGSGVGSLLLERLNDEYQKSTTMTYSVFPESEIISDVTVQPYNSVLTLKRLAENADAVVVLDNTALTKIATSKLQLTEPGYSQMNDLVSLVMAATTATLRFPSYSNNDMISLLAPLIPTPSCHFLMTGYTPIALSSTRQVVRKTSVIDVMNRLLDPNNIMMSTSVDKGMYISILNIIQGEVDPSEIHSALRQIRENKALRFIPWGPASLQLALSRRSQYVKSQNRVTGLMLANHTNIRSLFQQILVQFNKMFSHKANLHHYESLSTIKDGWSAEQEFTESVRSIQKVIDEYSSSEHEDFLTIDDDDYDE